MEASTMISKLVDIASQKSTESNYRRDLKVLMKRMKEKERALRSKSQASSSRKKKAALNKEISILRAQRKKGMALLRASKPKKPKKRSKSKA
ncbi:MAG: hypothetical protein CR978_00845 [Gammaproteobacteria bacterium]|nr:MAG: hypothetical protein CR978_00845 [Gammaproteobacteria bacterium]